MPSPRGCLMRPPRPIFRWRRCCVARRCHAPGWGGRTQACTRGRRALNTLGICHKGLGRFDDATRTLSEAVAVAERCGHPGAIAHSRMVLANLYHDLASFDLSVNCFRATLAPLAALASPRAAVEAYSSIARLAVVLGSGAEAETAAQRCEEGAQRSGLWRHRVTALLTKAEVCLCNSRPELAWPLVEEAAGITGDRSHLLPEAGVCERQQRQV